MLFLGTGVSKDQDITPDVEKLVVGALENKTNELTQDDERQEPDQASCEDVRDKAGDKGKYNDKNILN